MEWQPIETAPRDRVRILVALGNGEVVEGYYDINCHKDPILCYTSPETRLLSYYNPKWCPPELAPTDWQPLPEPPQPHTQEGK